MNYLYQLYTCLFFLEKQENIKSALNKLKTESEQEDYLNNLIKFENNSWIKSLNILRKLKIIDKNNEIIIYHYKEIIENNEVEIFYQRFKKDFLGYSLESILQNLSEMFQEQELLEQIEISSSSYIDIYKEINILVSYNKIITIKKGFYIKKTNEDIISEPLTCSINKGNKTYTFSSYKAYNKFLLNYCAYLKNNEKTFKPEEEAFLKVIKISFEYYLKQKINIVKNTSSDLVIEKINKKIFAKYLALEIATDIEPNKIWDYAEKNNQKIEAINIFKANNNIALDFKKCFRIEKNVAFQQLVNMFATCLQKFKLNK